MITPQQCAMARAALGLGIRQLAEIAAVAPNTIVRLERGERLHRRTLSHVQGILEVEGIAFIDPHAVSVAGGAGIRFGSEKSPMGQLFSDIYSLPDSRFKPEAAYLPALDIFERYLDIVKSDSRELDIWERINLGYALGLLCRGEVNYAIDDFKRIGITPPDNQSRD
jgi:transcriptional regulator with XRE-family HTH domain